MNLSPTSRRVMGAAKHTSFLALLLLLALPACEQPVLPTESLGFTTAISGTSRSIEASPDSITLNAIGDSLQLVATVWDRKGNPVSDPQVTWSSLDPLVATADSSGLVISSGVGIAHITATSSNAVDTTVVTVRQVVASISLSPEPATLVHGDSIQLVVTAADSNGVAIQDPTVEWVSSNTAVASIGARGGIKGVGAGSAEIAAIADGQRGTALVNVASPSAPSTWIFPGDDIQAKVNEHPVGTEFLIKAGVHRLQQVRPRAGNRFIGEPGTILSGARLLTSFTQEGSYWLATGQTQKGERTEEKRCLPGWPRCYMPEEFFIDHVPLVHVSSLAEVAPGKWFFDYDQATIYFADDPIGRTVETSVTASAFEPTANDVMIRGLVIEKYANPAQKGAIQGRGVTGWTVEDNLVQLNHGVGLRVGTLFQVRNNHILRNGQLGIGGGGTTGGDDILIENNEIAYNNTAGFDPGWEAGGTKFTRTSRLVVRGNHSHHNVGPGMWTDIDNIDTLYEDNHVAANSWMGIHHEISYAAVIRNNTIRDNGFGKTSWLWGGGIVVNMSSDVEIYGNVVADNADGIGGIYHTRGSGAYGPYLLQNLYVHNNTVTMSIGHTGIGQDVGDNSVFTDLNNRFENNTYYLGPNSHYFEWMNAWRHEGRWRGFGNDTTGTFIRK